MQHYNSAVVSKQFNRYEILIETRFRVLDISQLIPILHKQNIKNLAIYASKPQCKIVTSLCSNIHTVHPEQYNAKHVKSAKKL